MKTSIGILSWGLQRVCNHDVIGEATPDSLSLLLLYSNSRTDSRLKASVLVFVKLRYRSHTNASSSKVHIYVYVGYYDVRCLDLRFNTGENSNICLIDHAMSSRGRLLSNDLDKYFYDFC